MSILYTKNNGTGVTCYIWANIHFIVLHKTKKIVLIHLDNLTSSRQIRNDREFSSPLLRTLNTSCLLYTLLITALLMSCRRSLIYYFETHHFAPLINSVVSFIVSVAQITAMHFPCLASFFFNSFFYLAYEK